jgi:hypothetical protein
MILDRFPRFRINESTNDEGCLCYVGIFEPTPKTYVSWVGYLFDAEGRHTYGRFLRRSDNYRFYPEEPSDFDLVVGNTLAYLDGYWGERAALVLDKDLVWERTEFQPQDAFVPGSNPPKGAPYIARRSEHAGKPGRVIPSGWNHEHCSICWATIAQYAEKFGYRIGDTWICEKCHVESVVPRNLSFIPSAQ